jgi:hypothetical protein
MFSFFQTPAFHERVVLFGQEGGLVVPGQVEPDAVAPQGRRLDRQSGRLRQVPMRRGHAGGDPQRQPPTEAGVDLGEVGLAGAQHALHGNGTDRRSQAAMAGSPAG